MLILFDSYYQMKPTALLFLKSWVAIVFGMCVIYIMHILFSTRQTDAIVLVETENRDNMNPAMESPLLVEPENRDNNNPAMEPSEETGMLFTTDVKEKNNAIIKGGTEFFQTPTHQTIEATHSWTSSMLLPSVDTDKVSGRRLPLLPALRSDNWQIPPVELRGQVTLQTMFGQELYRLVQQPSVHLVLEIGTWYGGGSSWCIAQGLRSSIRNSKAPDKWLMTLELFEPAWEYASRTLERLPVTCMRGGTVGMDGYLKPEQMTAEDRSSEHYRLYYERDIKLAMEVMPLLERLCSTYDFDFVLIDGNEYTGLAEYEIVDRVCRPTYLALHDTGTLKTRRVEELLAEITDRWTKVSSGMDAAGWAVYQSTP